MEAGKEEPLRATIPGYAGSLGETEFDWKYKTQPEKSAIGRNKQVNWPRGKVRKKFFCFLLNLFNFYVEAIIQLLFK